MAHTDTKTIDMPKFEKDEFWSTNRDMVQALTADLSEYGLWSGFKVERVVIMPKRMDPTVPLTAWVFKRTPKFEEARSEFDSPTNTVLKAIRIVLDRWRYISSSIREAKRRL